MSPVRGRRPLEGWASKCPSGSLPKAWQERGLWSSSQLCLLVPQSPGSPWATTEEAGTRWELWAPAGSPLQSFDHGATLCRPLVTASSRSALSGGGTRPARPLALGACLLGHPGSRRGLSCGRDISPLSTTQDPPVNTAWSRHCLPPPPGCPWPLPFQAGPIKWERGK